jgi:hypothetical protein
MQYSVQTDAALKALTAVIARLGYTLKGVDNQNGIITFETGMSMQSWAGQSMSVHVLQVKDSVQITVGGNRKSHGAVLQVYDWGEANKIGAKVFEGLNSVLGPGQIISGSVPSNSSAVLVAVIVVLIIVIGAIVILAS